jgi:N-acetylmuramoyl-L-alanine amidase
MFLRSFLLSCCVTAAVASAAKPSADDAFEAAKADYARLKKDASRRGLRHHWINAGKRLDAVAVKFPKHARAPEALFLAGQVYRELSRLSGNPDDAALADRAWRRLVDGWPRHRLTADAAQRLERLSGERRGSAKVARKGADVAPDAGDDTKKDRARARASRTGSTASEGAGVGRDERGGPVEREPARTAGLGSPAPALGPSPAEAHDPPPPSTGSALAEALRRLRETPPLAPAVTERVEVSGAQGRRAPPPPRAEAELPQPRSQGDELPAVVEPGEASALASLQERLRDVRVGARAPDPVAKSRLAALAKQPKADELTLAQQLGLKVRRVVIDAGHGGHDTGAIGPTGVREKDVALAVTLRLKAKLEAMGLEVVLTRGDDTFVALDERTRIANRHHGDLFISIHCNAAPSKALRGIETYTLNTSSNRYSVRLAARENATTERGINDLQYILADLATKANTGESQHLAERVQRSLVSGLSKDFRGVRDLGTKEALFVVLLGAKMPAILVETSFLSNPEDEQRLASDEYQQALADQLAKAVDGFLDARTEVARVD